MEPRIGTAETAALLGVTKQRLLSTMRNPDKAAVLGAVAGDNGRWTFDSAKVAALVELRSRPDYNAAAAAQRLDISDRVIKSWVSKGYCGVYKDPISERVMFDYATVEARIDWLKSKLTVEQMSGIFGVNLRVVRRWARNGAFDVCKDPYDLRVWLFDRALVEQHLQQTL